MTIIGQYARAMLVNALGGALFGAGGGAIDAAFQGKRGLEFAKEVGKSAGIGAIFGSAFTFRMLQPLIVGLGGLMGAYGAWAAFEEGNLPLGIWRTISTAFGTVLGVKQMMKGGTYPWNNSAPRGLRQLANDVDSGAVDKIKGLPGIYDIVVHGSESGNAATANSPRGMKITAKQIADYIRAMPDYTGQAVRLIACYAGNKKGLASEVSKLLGVEVIAPEEGHIVNLDSEGGLYVSREFLPNGEPDSGGFNVGKWVIYRTPWSILGGER